MPVSRRRKVAEKKRPARKGGGEERRLENAGPYASSTPPSPILGRELTELEHLPLYVLGGFKLRKMVGRDRLYTNGETWLVVTVDEERRVTEVILSLLTPDEDHPDERYRIDARGKDGQPFRLSYQWAVLVHFAHGVLGLGPREASDLLSHLFRPGYLPLVRDGLRIDLMSGQFLGGPERLALGVRRADAEEYEGAAAPEGG